MPATVALLARVLAALVAGLACTVAQHEYACNVRALTESGWVCGLERWAENGSVYASFRAIPYAKQPLGDLRFKELEPAEPWGLLQTTEDGPVCYQSDVIYGGLVTPRGMSEACIHANVHVPIAALPDYSQSAFRDLKEGLKGLPILVFVHGGGFMSGSGDADLHGPEYLVYKDVVVITFNYRLNVFGFLSLDTAEVPGNQGLRDQITLLRWVQRNARAFGGDPDNVTLMGQSAGATSVHLLTLSEATKGLYNRAILMSGTAISGFYSPSPLMAQMMSKALVGLLGINATDAGEIHRQLVRVPAKRIHDVNKLLLDQFGLLTFAPTVEDYFPGVTRVIDDYPEALIAKGSGNDIPLIVGFTNAECEMFRPRLQEFDIAARIENNSLISVPVSVLYTTPPERLADVSEKIQMRYYNGTDRTQGFIDFCTDAYYKYPALKLARKRSGRDSAAVYLYQFSHWSEKPLRSALALTPYRGAAHLEDLTYVFRTNSQLGDHNSLPPALDRDDYMKDMMTDFVVNFMHCSKPVCDKPSAWPAVTPQRLQFQDLEQPILKYRNVTVAQSDILTFFDKLQLKGL